MAKKEINWGLAEQLYRAGQLTVRECAKQAGCSHVLLMRRAKAEGWTRDLTERVRAVTKAKLVTNAVTNGQGARNSERQVVEQAAETAAQIVRSHRVDITGAGALCKRLMGQLSEAVENRAEIEDDICEEMDPKIKAATNGPEKHALYSKKARMLAAVGLPSHATVMVSLSTAMKNLIGLERQAWNIDDDRASDTPWEDMLRKIHASA